MNVEVPRLPRTTMPLLANGDCMSQPEFHRRYEECHCDHKIELIGGIVYVASPLRWPHGSYHVDLAYVLKHYSMKTPGVDVGDNASTILGSRSEPQPDVSMRIIEEAGGQSRVNDKEYVVGAPELVCEVAHSTRAIDLHQKLEDYKRTGVREYLVLCIEEEEIHWHDFAKDKMIRPNRAGILRSSVFPGLWLSAQALLDRDSEELLNVLEQGLATPEHARFVKKLGNKRQRSTKSRKRKS